MYHVLSQQFGLTLMMLGRRPDKIFYSWKWLSIIGTVFIYSVVYGRHLYEHYSHYQLPPQHYAKIGGLIFILATIPYAYQLMKDSRTSIGVWYLWENVAMVTACLVVAWYDYYAFVIVIPRVIHDITAFIVYATHDNNRNKDKPINVFYRLTSFTHIPPWLLCPIIAMSIAYPLAHTSNEILTFITLTLIYFHYYFENFIWRGDSIHRQQVRFIK